MKCIRCQDAPALKYKKVCGCCEIAVHRSMMTILPAAVPGHYNYGVGQYIEDRDHLKAVQNERKDLVWE